MNDETKQEIAEFIADKEKRILSLYKVKDKWGKVDVIKPNITQARLLKESHTRNVIPKARQHGITTGVCVFVILDECLFNDNFKAAIIAHRESDALKIFASKIRFPYEQIPQYLKDSGFVPKAIRLTTSSIEFDNGSIITADTMVRSDTLQILHVSELAKMYQQFPAKAEEVKTGAIPAAEKGKIFIESTMEGRYGLMPDLCNDALDVQESGRKLTSKDFKFFFFPWYDNPEYQLFEDYPLSERINEYFHSLVVESGIHLNDAQKKWYAAEERIQGDKMQQEYPSTYKEAIEVSSDAYYYQKALNELRANNQINTIPVNKDLPTFTSWDLGFSDATAIWIVQVQGIYIRVVGYYENNNESLSTYVHWLRKWQEKHKVIFDAHYLPHDVRVHDISTGISRKNTLEKMGLSVTVLDRLPVEDGIDIVRELLPNCWFDLNACSAGIKNLDGYRKDVTADGLVCNKPKDHQKAGHGADSFRYMAIGLKKYGGMHENTLSKDDIINRSNYYRR